MTGDAGGHTATADSLQPVDDQVPRQAVVGRGVQAAAGGATLAWRIATYTGWIRATNGPPLVHEPHHRQFPVTVLS